MKTKSWMIALAAAGALMAGSATAASWQDQLSSAASSLNQNNGASSAAGQQSGGMSLSSLSGLLNGGNQSLSSNSMTNAAGVLQYCVQNNIVNNNADSVKDKLLGKLGLSNTTQASDKQDYQQGLSGLLNTGNNQQVNLQSLGDTQIGKKVKTKACDLVLKQGKQFIS